MNWRPLGSLAHEVFSFSDNRQALFDSVDNFSRRMLGVERILQAHSRVQLSKALFSATLNRLEFCAGNTKPNPFRFPYRGILRNA